MYDEPPSLRLFELEIWPPSREELWLAPSASEWKRYLRKGDKIGVSGDEVADESGQTILHLSLPELFTQLSNFRFDISYEGLRLAHVRLLLYPIFRLVHDYRNSMLSFPSSASDSVIPGLSFMAVQLSDIQQLLRRWFSLFERVPKFSTRAFAACQSSLLVYHLVNIELYSSFKEIEMFGRGGQGDLKTCILDAFKEHWLSHPAELVVHCGQIIKIIRETDVKLRPIWWAMASYRATIVLWSLSISVCKGLSLRHSRRKWYSKHSKHIVWVDKSAMTSPEIIAFAQKRTGLPLFTAGDGSAVHLDNPEKLLKICQQLLECGSGVSAFTEGVQAKLRLFSDAWLPFNQKLAGLSPTQ